MVTAQRALITLASASIAGTLLLAQTPTAHACGCFTPPDPSVPIVQAGERIVFGMENGKVTAHIQVQYSGPANEFGWLLPMPSLPEISIGTNELFDQVSSTTQPLYRLDREYEGNCAFDPSRSNFPNGAGPASDSSAPEEPGDKSNPLVLRDSIGPFDYAVLRADSKQPMLDWLDQEGFFVPAGTDTVVDPYIRPGAYFVAVKLLKGNDAGDIQPIVVTYASDLPMIPIVLTSVAADPDMGVQVWVLGEDRAIPRNYYHTMINDAKIDWLAAGANYVDVINDAVDEANEHQSFVTEYAGTTSIMTDVLDYAGRFGDLTQLAAITSAEQYINYLNGHEWTIIGSGGLPPFFQPSYSEQMLSILGRHLPPPQGLLDAGITASDYYTGISYYLGQYRQQNPEQFVGLDVEFDPFALTAELEQRVVDPTLAAGKLFKLHSFMTRMFTTLSPEEMTRDPVFSFNPDLPEVANRHNGRLIYYCGLIPNQDQATTPAKLITESGWELNYPAGTGEGTTDDNGNPPPHPWLAVQMQYSLYTQVLREEGAPEVVGDNEAEIRALISSANKTGSGCSVGNGSGGQWALLLLGFAIFAARRRREHR